MTSLAAKLFVERLAVERSDTAHAHPFAVPRTGLTVRPLHPSKHPAPRVTVPEKEGRSEPA